MTGWGGGIYYLQGAGLPVLLAPAIALGSDEPPEGRVPALVFVTLALLWSFGLAQWARLAGDVSGSPLAGVVAALAVAATPPFFLGGYNAYPETAVVAVLPWLMRAGLSDSCQLRTASVVPLGLVAGSLPWLHPKFLGLALVCLGVLGWRLRARHACLLALGLAAALPLCALLLFQFAVSGLLRFEGLYVRCASDLYGGAGDFASPAVLSGLMTALFGARDGLFVAAPVTLVAVLGLPRLWSRDRRAAIAVLLAGGSVWLVSSLIGGGAGGPPGRLMGPVTALFAVPLAVGLAELYGHLPFRWLLAATVLVSLVSVQAMRADWRRAVNPYRGVLTEATDFRRELPTEGRSGAAAPRSLAQAGVLLAALAFWTSRFRTARPGGMKRRRGPRVRSCRRTAGSGRRRWSSPWCFTRSGPRPDPAGKGREGLQASPSWVTRQGARGGFRCSIGSRERPSWSRGAWRLLRRRRSEWKERPGGEQRTARPWSSTRSQPQGHGGADHQLRRHRGVGGRPRPAGQDGDVVLGFDELEGYLGRHPYFGCIVGRYGNRIAKGRSPWTARSTPWRRTTARTTCTAAVGASTRWSGRRTTRPRARVRAVELAYLSQDGEEGYPGNLTVKVDLHAHRQERAADRLRGHHRQGDAGQPDEPRLLQPRGAGPGDILDHELDARRRHFTPVDEGAHSDGRAQPVSGHAVRLPQADRHRRAHRGRGRHSSRSAAATTTTSCSNGNDGRPAPRGARGRAEARAA